jgi:DprA winged helix domain
MNKIVRAQEEEYTRHTLKKFFENYPDEESCLRAFQANCKCCGTYNKQAYEMGERYFDCTNCNSRTWRTAGTFFHGLKYLQPTFASIWLHEKRAVISSNKLSELFNIVYSTAWKTTDRVKELLKDEMAKHEVFEIVSSMFDTVICKRSNLSVGGEHPSFEEEEINCLAPEVLESLDSDQAALCAVLEAKPIGFDILLERSGLPVCQFTAALSSLQIYGIACQHLGNKYSLTINTTVSISPRENGIVRMFLQYVRNFHGVSKKHLQKYIASFWARYCSKRWAQKDLMELCMRYGRPRRNHSQEKKAPKLVLVPTFSQNFAAC